MAAYRSRWFGRIAGSVPRLADQGDLRAPAARSRSAARRLGHVRPAAPYAISRRRSRMSWPRRSMPSTRWNGPSCSSDGIHLNRAGHRAFLADGGRRDRPPAGARNPPCFLTPRNSSSSWRSCWRSSTCCPRACASTSCWPPATSSTALELQVHRAAADADGHRLYRRAVARARAAGSAAEGRPGVRAWRPTSAFSASSSTTISWRRTWRCSLGTPGKRVLRWISCCRSASAFTPSRACRTWWTSTAASRRPCAIPWTTRCSSASSRNWWRGRSCGRAISSATCCTGSRPPPTTSRAASLLMVLGLDQEDGVCRPVRARSRTAISAIVAAHPGALAAWSGRVRFRPADLFRFLRLYRHGDRHGETARLSFPDQLPASVPGREHHRFLAALAHLAFHLAARLPVYPAGRQPPRSGA